MSINITNSLKTILSISLVTTFFGVEAVFADWQCDLEAQFDIVETFDNLQNWRGVDGLRGYDNDKSHMPIKEDGSLSMWDMYDEWFLTDTTIDWIANHGSENVWRGGLVRA